MTGDEEAAEGAVSIDPRLDAAIGVLTVPDHDDRFWHDLGERLIAEREAPAAPTPDPRKRLEEVDRREAPPVEERVAKTRERVRRKEARRTEQQPVAPAVTQLAEHAEWVRLPQRTWRHRPLMVACVIVAAIVLVGSIWLGGTAKKLAPTVTARQVSAGLSQRLAGARYVLGGVTANGIRRDNGRFAFVRAADGSFRFRALDLSSDIAFDATTGTAQSWHRDANGAVTATEDVGLAPGPPDNDGSSRYLPEDELGAIVRLLDQSPNALARPARRHGRDVWTLVVRPRSSPDARVDEVRLVVDQRSRLPVEISRSVKGTVIQRKQFTGLRLASEVRPDSFQVQMPPTALPVRFDAMFRRAQLPSVSAAVGYQPAAPGWLPQGFELSTVAVLPGSPLGLGATAGGDNPPDRDVVALAFRRGIEQLTVTLRRTGPADQWKDPFRSGDGGAWRVQRQRLDSGRFLGTTVEQVTTSAGAHHLWGRATDFVFTVSGDAELSQLLRIANSLS